MKNFFSKYLSIRISAIIILVEVCVFAAIGFFYFKRFSMEVDKRIETQVQIPGILMNRQLLRYESVADKEVMTELVGEEFVDGLVIGADSKIYYAFRNSDVRKESLDIPWVNDLGLGNQIQETTILKHADISDKFLICITPLVAYEGAEPFFFSYIKVRTNHSEARKNTIAGLLIIGSIVCVILTSIVIIWMMGKIVIRPLTDLKKITNYVALGDLNQNIATRRKDEIGDLAKSFVFMRDAVRKKIDDLNRLNKELQQAKNDLEQSSLSLEKKVNERTEALSRSERSLARAQRIARLGSWNWDILSNEVSCSDEFFQIFGVNPREPGMTYDVFVNFVHPEDREIIQNAVKAALYENEDYNIDYRIILPDGSERVVHAEGQVTFSKSRRPVQMIGIIQDITERQQAVLELEAAILAAETANRAKSEFLANMSHELRTPLNAILGFSQLMKRDPGISPEQRKNLETIGRSGEHLLSLINDVLEFSKIEAGQIVLQSEDFDLSRLMLGLEEMFGLRARQKGISLEIRYERDAPRYIHADQKKLRQILINLLGNAVKFTEAGGVVLSVRRKDHPIGESGDVTLDFEVTDTGCGISGNEQDRIFEAFYQSNSRLSLQQGTGLGLPISRKFVELMGGMLEVESKVGKGTCFRFNIRIQSATSGYTAPYQIYKRVIGLAADQPVFRLLVVEDDENNRNLLVSLLQSLGFEVRTAANGREGVEVWRQWRPHLIWMDIRMPIMNGYEALAIIRSEMVQTNSGMDTKIIALTASAFEEDRLKVLEHGGDDFVRKPFREAEIFEMLRKHLEVNYVFGQQESLAPTCRSGNVIDDNLIFALTALPQDLLGRLIEATELSDAAFIDQVIREVSTMDDQVAGVLSRLAANFEYDKILTLIQGPSQ